MMSDFIGYIVGAFLFALYIFGMYEIIVDDHRYTTKDVVIGAVVFPYPWWVGGKEAYRFTTTTSEDRETEVKCLDASEALGMPRKSRLRFCECFVETQDPEICKAKIFSK
jgi:hypothetical protein